MALGSCTCVYYKNLGFWSKVEKRKHFCLAAGFETSMGFHPLGQPFRQDESTSWGRFLNFTPRASLCDLEYRKGLVLVGSCWNICSIGVSHFVNIAGNLRLCLKHGSIKTRTSRNFENMYQLTFMQGRTDLGCPA